MSKGQCRLPVLDAKRLQSLQTQDQVPKNASHSPAKNLFSEPHLTSAFSFKMEQDERKPCNLSWRQQEPPEAAFQILCSKQSCFREVSSAHKTIPFYLEKDEKGWSSLENETWTLHYFFWTQDPSLLLLVYIIYDICVHTYHRGMFKKTWSLGITGSPQRI